MIKNLYGKYFQKSKSFLYPALGIKKNAEFAPLGTYVAIDGYIGPEDVKLICTYEYKDSKKFKDFEQQMLIENPLFHEKIEMTDTLIYIFDFEIYQNDWFNFLLGKYSKLSPTLKKAIKSYYGQTSIEYDYLDSYLNPEDYFAEYADLLDVDIQQLKKIGELCDACDLKKETFEIPKKYLPKSK